MKRSRTNFHVIRLQDHASTFCPVVVQREDQALKRPGRVHVVGQFWKNISHGRCLGGCALRVKLYMESNASCLQTSGKTLWITADFSTPSGPKMSIRAYRAYYHYLVGNARYILVHIPKNAGVAVRHSQLLRGRVVGAERFFHKSIAYTLRLEKVMKEAGEHHGIQHARYRDLRPSVVRRLQPVAIVRNPWARVVSRYEFFRTAVRQGSASPDYASNSFEEFLEERHIYGNKDLYWHRAIRGWYPQRDYVVDEGGVLSVDILRQEHLGKEAVEYFNLSEPLRRRNSSNKEGKKRDYRDYYTPKTIQIIADWYADDIETFGFDFDTGAKKNTFYSK